MKYIETILLIYFVSVIVSVILMAFFNEVFSKLSFREILIYIKNISVFTAAACAKHLFIGIPLTLILFIYGTFILFLSVTAELIRFVCGKMTRLLRNIVLCDKKIDRFFKKRMEKYFDTAYNLIYNYEKANEWQ